MEAQGGEKRSKHGNKLIKEYSEKLTKELGKGYTERNLRNMRRFYLKFQKWHALRTELSWTHYRILITLENTQAIRYYINISITQNLSYRELKEKIKSKEYERIGYKEELEEPKINTLIKNPIIIKTNNETKKVNEYMLHQLLLENISDFLHELGVGFAYINDEVKIKIGNRYNYIDFLLFNYKYNCFVVIELKVTEMKAEYIGQVTKYINYVNKHIKEPFNDNTVGVIICKKENKFIMEYCTDDRIFTTTYELT